MTVKSFVSLLRQYERSGWPIEVSDWKISVRVGSKDVPIDGIKIGGSPFVPSKTVVLLPSRSKSKEKSNA